MYKITAKFLNLFLIDTNSSQALGTPVRNNKKLQRYAKNNDAEVFEKSIYPEFFNKIAQELYAEQVSAFSKLFENKRFYDAVMEEVGREAYKDLRKDANPV